MQLFCVLWWLTIHFFDIISYISAFFSALMPYYFLITFSLYFTALCRNEPSLSVPSRSVFQPRHLGASINIPSNVSPFVFTSLMPAFSRSRGQNDTFLLFVAYTRVWPGGHKSEQRAGRGGLWDTQWLSSCAAGQGSTTPDDGTLPW